MQTAAGKKLDYQANYLLPAGKSDLLQKEVEQGCEAGEYFSRLGNVHIVYACVLFNLLGLYADPVCL